MKIFARILVVFAFVCLVIGGLALYWGVYLPRTAPPRTASVPVTPERVARGKYIFEVVSECNGCHTDRDFSRYGGPVVPGTTGRGVVMGEDGPPGVVIVAANITSDKETGIGGWTDGEKIRAIREGIGHDGNVLFPMMPYTNFRHMSDYDVESLVAYVNTLPPVKNKLPRTTLTRFISVMVRSAPQPVSSVRETPRDATRAYGEYLSNIGNCMTCHTQEDKGALKQDMLFAGGREFKGPGVHVLSANITPDQQTGIGSWSEDYFVQRFASQRRPDHELPRKVDASQFTVMPWLSFAHMDRADVVALYRYLMSLPTIPNQVPGHSHGTDHPAT